MGPKGLITVGDENSLSLSFHKLSKKHNTWQLKTCYMCVSSECLMHYHALKYILSSLALRKQKFLILGLLHVFYNTCCAHFTFSIKNVFNTLSCIKYILSSLALRKQKFLILGLLHIFYNTCYAHFTFSKQGHGIKIEHIV